MIFDKYPYEYKYVKRKYIGYLCFFVYLALFINSDIEFSYLVQKNSVYVSIIKLFSIYISMVLLFCYCIFVSKKIIFLSDEVLSVCNFFSEKKYDKSDLKMYSLNLFDIVIIFSGWRAVFCFFAVNHESDLMSKVDQYFNIDKRGAKNEIGKGDEGAKN